MILSQKLLSFFPFGVYCCLLTWWVSDHAFFWDTVQLASKHAHWYYEQSFQAFFLPETINSGHPPLFGMYVALCWCIFGKSLFVSHFSMLPFLLGIGWFLYEIGAYFGNIKLAKYLILLVTIDPFFAGQSILVSPDIVLIFAFVWCLFSILKANYLGIIFSAILLGLISMRGMMVTFSLYLWWCFTTIFLQKDFIHSPVNICRVLYKNILPFLPAGIIASTFLITHYLNFGWVGYHPNSPWAGSFEGVNFIELLKNVGILGWRFLDFGRLFLWGTLAWCFWKIGVSNILRKDTPTFQLISLILILSLILTPSLLLHKGLLSHRYLLPIVLSITLLFYHLCFQIIQHKMIQNIIFSITIIGLLTGNLWIYPKQIAQGWDATLAHVPYYHLRKKMINYIEQQEIPPTKIGTVFPNIGPFEIYDLNKNQIGFVKKDFTTNEYFFYATVFNDLSDADLLALEKNWEIVQQFETFGIEAILYKR